MSVEHDGPDDVRLIDVRVAELRGWTNIKFSAWRQSWYGVPPESESAARCRIPSAHGYTGCAVAMELILDMVRAKTAPAQEARLLLAIAPHATVGDFVDAVVAEWIRWREMEEPERGRTR